MANIGIGYKLGEILFDNHPEAIAEIQRKIKTPEVVQAFVEIR
jgi:hypothetical protein